MGVTSLPAVGAGTKVYEESVTVASGFVPLNDENSPRFVNGFLKNEVTVLAAPESAEVTRDCWRGVADRGAYATESGVDEYSGYGRPNPVEDCGGAGAE